MSIRFVQQLRNIINLVHKFYKLLVSQFCYYDVHTRGVRGTHPCLPCMLPLSDFPLLSHCCQFFTQHSKGLILKELSFFSVLTAFSFDTVHQYTFIPVYNACTQLETSERQHGRCSSHSLVPIITIQ